MTVIDVSRLRDDVNTIVRVDVVSMTPVDAMNLVQALTPIKNALCALELKAAAVIAEGDEWRRLGHDSAADWLAGVTGCTSHVARDRIACGRRLNTLGTISGAAIRGELSPEKAMAIADAASHAPDKERELLDAATTESLSEVRDRCAQAKAVADPDPDATYERLRRQRRVTRRTDAEGAGHLHYRGTPDGLAEICSELDRLTDQEFNKARKDGRRESLDAYAADALLEMARRSRRLDMVPADNGKKRRGVQPKWLGLIHADLSAVVRGHVADGERCEIAGIGPIPVSLARELLGDAILELVCTNGRDANVTHVGRGPNAIQKLVMLWRSPTCSVKGCNRRARLQADHIEEFRYTRHTTLEEMRHMCHPHHELKTRHGWEVINGPGKQPMVPPTDPRHPRHPRNFPRNEPSPEAGAA